MKLPAPGATVTSPGTPRIICYHQTHYLNGKFVSILPLLTHETGVTHVIVAAIHINEPPGNITLNDLPYSSPSNEPLWLEVFKLQKANVKVLGMLGGAALGSFTRLDGDTESFKKYYEPLREMIVWTGLQGLDLDVEEEMSLSGIIRLITRLKSDFGTDFLLTLAPVATALQNGKHLSGFDYEDLEAAVGHHIAWYNTQFYCGWGTLESPADYETIVERGWPPEKVVAGLVTNPANCRGWVADGVLRETLEALVRRFPRFGGVMGWEYFNSMTEGEGEGRPWVWAAFMNKILRDAGASEKVVESSTSDG